ncbi:MAG: CNP1-like family protein [Variovorax sp.]
MPIPESLRRTTLWRRRLAACLLALPLAAAAQLADQPDWSESKVPPAPKFDQKRLLPIEVGGRFALDFGIDPQTVVVTPDGVVRYVVVASSSRGALNAFYEGIRCGSAQMKTYARFTDGAWHNAEKPEWEPIKLMSSGHTRAIAVQAVCEGRAPRLTTAEIIDQLRQTRPNESSGGLYGRPL